MQFRLRTLLIVLALGPPLLAGAILNYLRYREQIARAALPVPVKAAPARPVWVFELQDSPLDE